MYEAKTLAETWQILGTPNSELDDERLQYKANVIGQFAADAERNGDDYGAYKKRLEEIECEKELDRRHGVVRQYRLPQWPPAWYVKTNKRRRSSR